MERIKLKMSPTRAVTAVVTSTIIYETAAIILNKEFGVGLPYFPWQMTPSNSKAAVGIYATTSMVSLLAVSID